MDKQSFSMSKRSALKILIEHTFLLDDDAKVVLADSIPKLNDEQVEQLGVLLATEKKLAIENSAAKIANYNKLLKRITKSKVTKHPD
jgi:dsDNA-binding SOS-regulon protein